MPGNFELQGLLIANSVSVALTLLANVFALGLITHKVMCVPLSYTLRGNTC